MIIRKATIFFPKLVKPSSRFNKENPTWELQIRTKSKAQRNSWREMGLNVKLVEDDENGDFYRVNLKKKSKKQDGTPGNPIEVCDGNLNPIDPNTIGNGSVGNIRIFQSEYENAEGKTAIRSTPMKIQLTKHIVYEFEEEEGFEMLDEETEVIVAEPDELEDDIGREDDDEFDEDESPKAAPKATAKPPKTPKTPKPPKPKVLDDIEDEDY
jgi:hypothetical protein